MEETLYLSKDGYNIILKQKDGLIKELEDQINFLLKEKADIIENFKATSNILIEKIKELESQNLGYRPQTAQVIRPQINRQSSAKQNSKPAEAEFGSWDNPIEEAKENDRKLCLICKNLFIKSELEVHTIMCSRSSTKCKACGEYIPNKNSSSHTSEWTNPENIYTFMKNNNLEKFKLGFSHGADINHIFEDKQKSTYLHLAVSCGSTMFISILLGLGIDIEKKDSEGNTALILASQNDNFLIFKKLIEEGANIEAKNNIGWNSLFYVCKKGNIKMLNLLLEKKVNLNESNKLGDSCMKIAQKNGNQEIVVLLVNKGLSLRPMTSKLSKNQKF